SAEDVEEAEGGGVAPRAEAEADERMSFRPEVVLCFRQPAPVEEGAEGVLERAVAEARVRGRGAVDDAQGGAATLRGQRSRAADQPQSLVHGGAVEVERDGGAVVGELREGHGESYGAPARAARIARPFSSCPSFAKTHEPLPERA